MADDVSYIDPQHNQLPLTDWRKLGELKLRAGPNPDGSINAWLTHILSDFSLPNDLVARLLKSMEDSAGRVLSAEELSEHLEIVVLAPAYLLPQGQTWGFFRLERASADSQFNGTNGHCVEYYLYLDQKTER